MTVSSTTRSAGPFAGNSIVTAFPFAFRIFATTDVLAVITDAAGNLTTLNNGVDYTVAMNVDQTNNPGGTINTTTAPLTGTTLTATSAVTVTQPTAFPNAGPFFASIVEAALDRITVIAQQLGFSTGKGLQLPISSTASNQLPAPVANNFLGWNGAASAIINYAGAASSAVSAAMAPVVSAASLAAARAAMGVLGFAGGALTGALTFTAGLNNVASAATVNLSAVTANTAHITGVAGISAITMTSGQVIDVIFDGILTLTHHATNNNLPGGANITTAANDRGRYWYDGTTVWCVAYNRTSGTALVAGADTGLVANTRNAKMSVTAASATGTFTADEIVVESALGGTSQKLASYSQACNLATTGAGGMDTGTAPVSGFVSLYAIAKPDGTKNILACAVATSTASIYGGANMPAGYSLSALIGIWPTNGSSQFVPGVILAPTPRRFEYQTFPAIYTGHAAIATLTSQSVSAGVPAAARTCSLLGGTTTANQFLEFFAAADATGTGARGGVSGAISGVTIALGGAAAMSGQALAVDIPLITAQTVYVAHQSSGSTNNLYATGYSW